MINISRNYLVYSIFINTNICVFLNINKLLKNVKVEQQPLYCLGFLYITIYIYFSVG